MGDVSTVEKKIRAVLDSTVSSSFATPTAARVSDQP